MRNKNTSRFSVINKPIGSTWGIAGLFGFNEPWERPRFEKSKVKKKNIYKK